MGGLLASLLRAYVLSVIFPGAGLFNHGVRAEIFELEFGFSLFFSFFFFSFFFLHIFRFFHFYFKVFIGSS